jgi:hypothetical protein
MLARLKVARRPAAEPILLQDVEVEMAATEPLLGSR